MRVIVTGASGFLGKHVIDSMMAHDVDVEVVGVTRKRGLQTKGPARLVTADLRDESVVRTVLGGQDCDVCVHLAGVMPPQATDEVFRTNVLATANLLRYVRLRKVVLISSAAVYGPAGMSGLVTEEMPPAPVSSYGLSCLARECVASMYCKEKRVELIILRLFNLVGPGQGDHMMAPNFARQIALIEASQQEPRLHTRRLDTWRDYVDVRDAAVAISAVVFKEGALPHITNIGSGVLYSGQQVLDELLALTDRPIEVISIREPAWENDVPRMGNGSNLAASSLGWTPARQLIDSLADVLEDWRERIVVSPGPIRTDA